MNSPLYSYADFFSICCVLLCQEALLIEAEVNKAAAEEVRCLLYETN